MEDFIPQPDITLQINKDDIIALIQHNIHQVSVDKEALLINLRLLVHTDVNKEELKSVIHNVCCRITPETLNKKESSPIIDELANYTQSFLNFSTDNLVEIELNENNINSFNIDGAFNIDDNLLEIICILYLKSIRFNLAFFIKKTKINEKHNIKITLYREVRHYEIKSLSNLTDKYIKKYDKDINLSYLRIFITSCLLNDEVPLLPSSVLYYIKYLLKFDPNIIVEWIKSAPKSYPCKNITIPMNFPIIELKYIKNIEILMKINSNKINARFIEHIIKKTNFSEEFYKLVVSSHSVDNPEPTLLICKLIQSIYYKGHLELIKRLMIIDKTSFNDHFIDLLNVINSDIIDIFVINHRLLDLCNTKILSDIFYNNEVSKLFNNYKIYKYFLRILSERNMLDMEYLSRIITDPKKIIYIYKKYKVETKYFYKQVINIINRLIQEYKEVTKLKEKKLINEMQNKTVDPIIEDTVVLEDTSCLFNNSTCYIENTGLNCDTSFQDITQLEIDFTIFNIKNQGSCNCFKKKVNCVIKLLFVYNNPEIPSKLIYKIYLMNKKKFTKHFGNFTDYNTLYIKIFKILPIKPLITNVDYWNAAVLHKLKQGDIPRDGLYFNKSFIKFNQDSKTFTLNISLIQCAKEGNQRLINLFNNEDYFVIGINEGCLYTESFIKNRKIFKENSCDTEEIYLELFYSNKKLNFVVENRKYTFDIFHITDIVIGEEFKGILTKMVYFESNQYNKSRILHLNKSELYIKVIKNIEMWCISRSLGGFFINSKKVYWWHRKKEVQFYNIIEIN